jgi:hypothetical protein
VIDYRPVDIFANEREPGLDWQARCNAGRGVSPAQHTGSTRLTLYERNLFRVWAAFLISVLAEDRPEDLAEAYEAAIGNGVKWRDRIAASLKRMPQTFAILEAL